MELIIIILILVILYLLYRNDKLKKNLITLRKEHVIYRQNKNFEIEALKTKFKKEYDFLVDEYASYRDSTEYLRKYEAIKDVEIEIQRLQSISSEKLEMSNQDAKSIISEAKKSAREIRLKAEEKLLNSHKVYTKMESEAISRAQEIAGDAWDAKANSEQYSQTVNAMKNIINGYGDEYLIPHDSILDQLAEDYNHTIAGRDLANIRLLVKSMIKNNEVGDCDYIEQERRTTAIEFVIDAFNGKVESIMSKVKHDNFGILNQKLEDAYRIVNHNGRSFRNARILKKYFDVIRDQLRLSVIVNELKRKDQAEQKAIREAIREEERAKREYEKAIREAEKEEKLIAKALKQAEAKLKGAANEERQKFEFELKRLQEELEEAHLKGQRAISMAQQTRRGHVYIISNVGSFGENIFKIGLTRRLNPLDRVKELGDASVPFSFDVHAIIFAEDAPNLEKLLHIEFKSNQVNKVNPRKEFFNLSLIEIKTKVDKLNINTHWTMKADAMEYRESLQIANQAIEN